MSYFVTVSFDLKDANWEDYSTAYDELAKLGLTRSLVAENGNTVTLPTTTCCGTWNGTNAALVRDAVREKATSAFSAKGLTADIFVAVGANWAWGFTTSVPLAKTLFAGH